MLNNENSPQSLYNNLYTQFELGEYQEVIDGCDLQIIKLDGDEIIPKLELLKVTSRARLYGFEAYKEGLNFVALNYPSSIEGKKAAQMYSSVIPELANKAFVEDSTQNNFKVVFKFERSETKQIQAFEKAVSTAVEEVDFFELTVSKDSYDTNTIFVVVHGLKSVQGALGFASMFGLWYNIVFALLIIVFTYFYTAITVPTNKMADDLKRSGGFIPGIRPGSETSEYLDKIMSQITLPGSMFLALIAVFPAIIVRLMDIQPGWALFFGGTSLLIMVGVAIDTMQQVNSYLLNKHYDGLMKTGKNRKAVQ